MVLPGKSNCVAERRIALIRDDDVLFSTDDSDFPQLLREVAARGLDRVANRSPLEEQVKQERDRREKCV